MPRIYSEEDITWSSIEKCIPYHKVEWTANKNGISSYKLFDEEGKRIYINDYINKIY